MAAFAFALPILPGQEETVRSTGEAVSGSEEFREEYEASRERLVISEVRVRVQRTPIVKDFCRAHSIAYHETGVLRSYREILQHLHEVGAPRSKESEVRYRPALWED